MNVNIKKSRISGEFENESKFSGEIPNFVEHGRILLVLDTVEDCNFMPTLLVGSRNVEHLTNARFSTFTLTFVWPP